MSIREGIQTRVVGQPPEALKPSQSTKNDDECLDPVQSPDSKEKRIVVFVSSTFRDMVAERDELTLRIFPELRKVCEERGIAWGEVDLRWGIPPKREQEQVLETCLRFIDQCRPYFIGILGQRYGWTGVNISEPLGKEFPWLKKEVGRSITELEILHGALNDPGMADHAFFYFRDPAYLKCLLKTERSAFHETATEKEIGVFGKDEAERRARGRRTRQVMLKRRIRKSGLPVRENYPSPEALGEFVREDLLKVIDELAPTPSEKISDVDREITALDREAVAHEAFARSRFGVYVPRQVYFDRLDEHAAGDGLPLAITGESGSGKSALLAHWTDRYTDSHPEAVVIRHFVGATSDSADLTAMLRRFMGEFRRWLGVLAEIPKDDAAVRAAFPNWLSMAAAKGRIVIIIDALNQLEDRHGALDLTWIPPVVPANVRLVVSTLPGRVLEAVTKRGWSELNVEPLTVDERRQVIRCYLKRFYRELSPGEVDRIAATEQAKNPLFLRAVIEELRVHGEFARLPNQITAYLAIPTIPKLFEAILTRYERDYERDRPGLVRDLCTFVWASRRGLSRDELRDLLGKGGRPLPDAAWAPLLLAMQQGLVVKGDVFTFFHDYLREAVQARYLTNETDITATHFALAGYFERQPLGPRQIEEFPWQLAAADAWDRLVALLTEPTFFSAVYRAREYDLKHYWVRIEIGSLYRMVDAFGLVILEPATFPLAFLRHLRDLLYDTGHLNEAGVLGEYLVKSSRKLENISDLQASLGNQANILYAHNDLEGAMVLYKEQELICIELGDDNSLQKTLGNQALILRSRDDLDDAMTLFKEQERICCEIGNVEDLQASLGNQALILRANGDLDGAMKLLKEQERICCEIGNVDNFQISLGNQGNILKDRGDFEGAMALYKKQEQICLEIGNVHGLQISLGNQGNLLYFHGDLDGAMELYKKKEQICHDLGNKKGLAMSLANQAIIHVEQDRRAEAILTLDEAFTLASSIGYRSLISQILRIKELFGL